jgi:hypothetical protein
MVMAKPEKLGEGIRTVGGPNYPKNQSKAVRQHVEAFKKRKMTDHKTNGLATGLWLTPTQRSGEEVRWLRP